MSQAVQLIRKVQNKEPLTKDEVFSLIQGFENSEIPDYQMSAFLMAVYYQGLTLSEKEYLTEALLKSGVQMKWETTLPVVDKHSTGGIGDKTSMILNPLLAAMDFKIPMMAGRGLGHTGGTLDKLESLNGFNVNLDLDTFKKTVLQQGGAIIGQTKDFCPADKKLYALRDVTATVSSLPLITASIVSKKIAEGAKYLIYDVKTGSGAFIKDFSKSKELAHSLVETSKKLGATAAALITDMSQPLGRYVGNECEMYECFKILKNSSECYEEFNDTIELTLGLCASLVSLTNNKDYKDNYTACKETLFSGKAYEKALEIYKSQGWDGIEPTLNETYVDFKSPSNGYLAKINNEHIGWASVELGGGRKKLEDTIDHKVGFYFYKKLGDPVKVGEPLVKIFYTNETRLNASEALLQKAFEFTQDPPKIPKLIQTTVKE